MIVYCKKCGREMEETDIDDRQEFSYNTYYCSECEREITEKIYKPTLTL